MRNIFDIINSYQHFGLSEMVVLTAKQADEPNPFSQENDRYRWLARASMVIVTDEELDKLETAGFNIDPNFDSKIHGKCTLIYLGIGYGHTIEIPLATPAKEVVVKQRGRPKGSKNKNGNLQS